MIDRRAAEELAGGKGRITAVRLVDRKKTSLTSEQVVKGIAEGSVFDQLEA